MAPSLTVGHLNRKLKVVVVVVVVVLVVVMVYDLKLCLVGKTF